jgi:hypothetical protein
MASVFACSQGTRRLPKFHESPLQNSGRDSGKGDSNAEKALEGLSVVKEGQAETGRALKTRDLVGVTLASRQQKPGRSALGRCEKECAESSHSYYPGHQ